jgi:DNA repair protein RadC
MAKDADSSKETEYEEYTGHRERLKVKFLKCSEALADYELLELLLTYSIPRRDVKPYAKNLLKRFGSLEHVLNSNYDELTELKGIGVNTGVLLSLVKELFSRCLYEQLQERDILNSPDAVIDFVRSKVGFSLNEIFMILYLNSRNHIVGYEIVSEGTTDSVVVYPRVVVKQVLKYNATGIIAVHNHPSGECEPSANDLNITRILKEALFPLDVRFMDHIIISGGDSFSFQTEGLL